jgi:hypothetical protein
MQLFTDSVTRFMLINYTMQIKMSLVAHQNIVWRVWITSHQSQKLMTKLKANLFIMDTEVLYNFSSVGVKVQFSVHDIVQ